jgi:hypothetical protein
LRAWQYSFLLLGPARNRIVRWKLARQLFVSIQSRKKSMSSRVIAGIVLLLALSLGVAVYLLIRPARIDTPSAIASENPPPAVADTAVSGEPTGAEGSAGDAKAKGVAKKDAVAPDGGLPLRSGEVLDFSADLAKVSNVATLRLQTAEKRNFQGKPAWHLQALAHTQNPLRMVFELDDQFDSYSDASTMTSLQYELHLSERGQKVTSIQRLTSTGKEPAPAGASQTIVLPGTRDPLGFMQYLRNVDWSKTPKVAGPVYDGHKLYDVRASLASPAESVSVPAGNFTAKKIEIHVFADGAEMKDAQFSLYLADDPGHTPVLLEAILPWTTARVGLKSKQQR